MTKPEILKAICLPCFYQIAARVGKDLADDLFQFMWEEFYNLDTDKYKVETLDQLKYLYARMAKIQAQTANGTFYRLYHRVELFVRKRGSDFAYLCQKTETFDFEFKSDLQVWAERQMQVVRPEPKRYNPDLMPTLF